LGGEDEDLGREIYTSGQYQIDTPSWHVEDSPWKAEKILMMLRRNSIIPRTICEVGCGAGEILYQLQIKMDDKCEFWGYEISPYAFSLCQKKGNNRLHFFLQDILELEVRSGFFDLMLLIDLIEHIENYMDFLRKIKKSATYMLFHIPLELSIDSVLRNKLFEHRMRVGHLHYFNREIALHALQDAGFSVMDHFYTFGSAALPAKSAKARLGRVLRKMFTAVSEDFAARTAGGAGLMVLAR
jgi:hypothetical protein